MKSLLQSAEWINLKVSQGWKSHEIDGIYVLEKPLPFGKSFLYAPELAWDQIRNKNVIASFAKQSDASGIATSPAAPRNDSVIFYRLEILDEYQSEIVDKLKKHGFIKAFEEVQPEWRQIVDISKSEAEILSQMKPKGRYNIKIAQKHRVEVTVCPIDRLNDGVAVFYDLYQQSGRLQKFEIRGEKYFLDLAKILYPKGQGAIIIARYQNVPLSAIIITFYDQVASYLYGGTSRLNKNVMAPYAAHWEAILEAKKRGCKTYDLLAISPDVIASDSEAILDRRGATPPRDDSHKYAGITQFKEQLGGRKVHLIGSWDLVYRPGWYKMFKIAEKLRRR